MSAVADTAAETETEVFYTFTWAPRRRGGGDRPQARQDGEGGRPRGKKPRGGKPEGKPGDRARGKGGKPQGGKREQGPRTYTARPERPAKVDPDNPFAVLAALKDKS
jgi:ATP-dependent RNA helicase SUPV3L1/SUV3